MSEVENLWGPAEVARFLGYAESTVIRMATVEPAKLPPRVASVFKPRWSPEVCRKWAATHSAPVEKRKVGRPRKVVT